ncbi:dihydrofolate reductase [Secundilactobacillus odoratitofui]|uniref:dihydrofolate reductase n=1 Tax=Secundilactobacillus odoratitofui TaxID=480930 RepID=UPI000A497752|nr:dihydrofolate reductase [Secundilactobacillus odoratitofui]
MIFIWAEDQNHGIGLKGTLPWHLPADLKFFKQTTMGNTLVSGRRTFASYKKTITAP